MGKENNLEMEAKTFLIAKLNKEKTFLDEEKIEEIKKYLLGKKYVMELAKKGDYTLTDKGFDWAGIEEY